MGPLLTSVPPLTYLPISGSSCRARAISASPPASSPSLRFARLAEVVGGSAFGIEPDRFSLVGDSAVVVPFGSVRAAPVVEGCGVFRIPLSGSRAPLEKMSVGKRKHAEAYRAAGKHDEQVCHSPN